jgi:hypothetical protein
MIDREVSAVRERKSMASTAVAPGGLAERHWRKERVALRPEI